MLPGTGKGNPRAGTFVEQQIVGLRSIGVDVEVVLIDRVNKGVFEYFRTGRAVSRAVERSAPKIVHFMTGGVLGVQGIRAVSGTPTVISYCGTDLLGDRLATGIMRFRVLVGRLCSLWAAGKASWIVVKSRNLEEALPRRIDRRRVSVVPNGVSFERFRPLDRQDCRARLNWAPGTFHVVLATHGRGDRNKRVGLAEAAIQEALGLGVPAELHLMVNVSHDDVPLWLNAADALLMTSRQEGSPNIVKEALACNRPVVSVDVGDVRERIEGIEGCHLAEPDPVDLGAKLAVVAAGPRVVAARDKLRDLTLEAVARRLVKVYEAAIEAGAGR